MHIRSWFFIVETLPTDHLKTKIGVNSIQRVFGMENINGMEKIWIRRGNGNNDCYL